MTTVDRKDVYFLMEECGCTRSAAKAALKKYGDIVTAFMKMPMNPRPTPDRKFILRQSSDKLLLELRDPKTGKILWKKDLVEPLRLDQSIVTDCGTYKLCGDQDGDVQPFMAKRVRAH